MAAKLTISDQANAPRSLSIEFVMPNSHRIADLEALQPSRHDQHHVQQPSRHFLELSANPKRAVYRALVQEAYGLDGMTLQ
jgi:hypothetical protein